MGVKPMSLFKLTGSHDPCQAGPMAQALRALHRRQLQSPSSDSRALRSEGGSTTQRLHQA
jgi:hypothetical protein